MEACSRKRLLTKILESNLIKLKMAKKRQCEAEELDEKVE